MSPEIACLFQPQSVAHCGSIQADVLGGLLTSWPLALGGLCIIALLVCAYLRSIYGRPIDHDAQVDAIKDSRERRLRRAANEIVDPDAFTTPGV